MERGWLKSKKGVSPVIATILLILLMIALFIIVFWWASQFIEEQVTKFDGNIEDSCEAVDIEVSIRSGGELGVVNLGNIDIFGLDYTIKTNDGNEETHSLIDDSFPLRKGESIIVEEFFIDPEEEEIIIYPVLLGTGEDNTNKQYVCLNYGIEVYE